MLSSGASSSFRSSAWPDFQTGTNREWLVANKMGGFASSTLIGANVRRYHGLLLLDLGPPYGPCMLLNQVEEVVSYKSKLYALSTNQYPGAIHPQGYHHLTSFALHPFPTFEYELGDLVLEKRIVVIEGMPLVGVEYRVKSGDALCTLGVRPLINFRSFHHLTREQPDLRPHSAAGEGELRARLSPSSPWLHIAHNAGEFVINPVWNRRVIYPVEMERGLDFEEDLFSPGYLHFQISQGDEAMLVASLDPLGLDRWKDEVNDETERRKGLLEEPSQEIEGQLQATFDQFLCRKEEKPYLIAGYPWFGEWGRDTLISVSRVPIQERWASDFREILLSYAERCDEGMLPNLLASDSGVLSYNQIDATLWFFEAVYRYVEQTGDLDVVKQFAWETMTNIIRFHEQGTRYGIHLNEEKLIQGGDPQSQLTWMDAKVGGEAVTPRHGMAVEINALWYNALCCCAALGRRSGEEDTAQRLEQLAKESQASFLRRFWMEEEGWLKDCIHGDGMEDRSLRPNQVMAASLSFPVLHRSQAKRMLDAIGPCLLTPYGLRSLQREDPRYVGIYAGPPERRDRSYHQGTVWAWLLGEYIKAAIYALEEDEAQSCVTRVLEGIQGHLAAAGLGGVSEIFDGDPPHRPRGCPWQAWSVAALLCILETAEEL